MRSTDDRDEHERPRELLALGLYGELAPGEERELERHLAACAVCRSFAAELDAGLGALVPGRDAHDPDGVADLDDLPPGWAERLAAAARAPAPSRATWNPLLTFAAGLAAGLLVMAMVRVGSPSHHDVPLAQGVFTNAGAPEIGPDLSTPPPLATGRGPLARLSSFLHRRE